MLAYWHRRQFEISDGNISVKKENTGQSQMKSHLTLKNSCSGQTQQVINDALSKIEDGVNWTKAFQENIFRTIFFYKNTELLKPIYWI